MSYQKRKKKAVQEISEMQKIETKEGAKKPKEIIPLDINIKEFPWTEKQKIMIEVAQMAETKIIMVNAPPGVGKSLISVYVALTKLKQKKVNKVMYLRVPVEACSHGVGYLPAGLSEKLSPFMQPCEDQMKQLINPVATSKLISSGVVEAMPVGFMKGRTLIDTVVIADEIEDCTVAELRMVISRLGKNCLMFIIGDENQSSIRQSGFKKVFDAFNNEEAMNHGIFCFQLGAEDSMRSGITKYLIETFDKIPK
jgi:phosphate starvation-inducible PhoH-like protein